MRLERRRPRFITPYPNHTVKLHVAPPAHPVNRRTHSNFQRLYDQCSPLTALHTVVAVQRLSDLKHKRNLHELVHR
jgi:hypothetical protein